jgi:hypothetical protein
MHAITSPLEEVAMLQRIGTGFVIACTAARNRCKYRDTRRAGESVVLTGDRIASPEEAPKFCAAADSGSEIQTALIARELKAGKPVTRTFSPSAVDRRRAGYRNSRTVVK